MAELPSFIRTGSSALTDRGSGVYISLKDGDTLEIVPITGVEGIISFDQHAMWRDEGQSPIFPCIKTKDCPGCLLGDQPRFRALLQVIVRTEEGRQKKILPIGTSLFKQLVEIEEAIGTTMKGAVIRISRKGMGLTTRYNAVPVGRKTDILDDDEFDMIEHIGPTTAEEIILVLKEAKMWPPKAVKKVAALGKTSKFEGADKRESKKAADWGEEEFVDDEDA